MGKNNNTLLILLAGGAALWFLTQKKNADAEGKSTMSEAEAALRIKQEETEQKKLELDYLKEKGERDWSDVALDFASGAASKAGEAVGGWLGQLSF